MFRKIDFDTNIIAGGDGQNVGDCTANDSNHHNIHVGIGDGQ